MRMLNDSPTVAAVGAPSSAPPPLLAPAPAAWMVGDEGLQQVAEWRHFAATIHSILLIATLCTLGYIICIVLDGWCTEHAPAPAPPPPHAAAAAATAAGGGPATDAWLNKRGLRRIPVVVYEAKPGASSATDCVICLGEFDDGDKVCVLPRCHRAFHEQCIDLWLAAHPSCPTCRNSLLI